MTPHSGARIYFPRILNNEKNVYEIDNWLLAIVVRYVWLLPGNLFMKKKTFSIVNS
jgi:hypothetical protein